MTTYRSWFVLQNGHGTWKVFLDADPMEILWMSPTRRVLQILGSLNLQWEVYLGSGKINNGYLSALPMPHQQVGTWGIRPRMSTEDPR